MIGVVAALGPSAYWYLARGTGAVALLLLTASVILGVLGSLRFSAGTRWPRFTIDALHRDVSLLVIVLIVVHVVTSVLDGFAPIGLLDGLVPLHSSYRSLWLGLGALSFDLLLALVATSLARRRLGYGAWRAVHWLAYASWPVAVLHGLGTGTDTQVWWMLALTAVCVAAVLAAILARLYRSRSPGPRFLGGAAAVTLAATAGIALFTVLGPLQSGWARRAGTPASLLGPAATKSARTSVSSRLTGFSARLDGQLTQSAQTNGTVLDLALRVSQGAQGELRVRMAGAPRAAGGLSLTGSQVDLALTGQPATLQGRIVALQGARFLARVAAGGRSLDLRANLQIDPQSGSVSGSLSGSPAG